jgi:cytoskeleton protein RodZ
MDFSELRHARELLGLSLRDIADRTKIRTTILGAIENNDVDHLPPPIFTRGFVKAYAREVGLDPQAFAEMLATPQPLAAAAGDVRTIESAFEDRSERYNLSERETSSVVTAALIVVVGLVFLLSDPWKSSPPSTENTASSAAGPTATDGAALHGAVATTGPSRPTIPSVPRSPNMRIDLAPRGPCWIEATADGERVIYRLLNAGDRYAIEGYEDLVLKVGDPAALAFSINGARGRPLGRAGRSTTVHITRGNSHEFTGS